MRPVILRLAACGLVVLGWVASASAQVTVLRGPQSFEPAVPHFADWSGFYVGGHAGFANAGVDLSGGVQDLVANILRVTTVESEFQPSRWANLPAQDATRAIYGGFFGYNVQYGETIFGLEANYNHTDMQMTGSDSVGRQVQTSDGYINQVFVSGSAGVQVTDYATLRGRAAWLHNGFMPYGFLGVAVGQASAMRTASVMITATDADPTNPPVLPDVNFSASQSDGKKNAIIFGWALGIGVDWAVLPNVFLRVEYEYVAFPSFQGTDIAINSARIGAGIRF